MKTRFPRSSFTKAIEFVMLFANMCLSKSMSSVAHIEIHSSQFPDRIQADLIDSLRARTINHKFHYDSHRQIQRWLAVHEAYSPARADLEGQAVYAECFDGIASRLDRENEIHVISLGCGGGQKDVQLLEKLIGAGRTVNYTPIDVTPAMTLVAREAASAAIPVEACHPFVCDLATAEDLPEALDARISPSARRVILFFGMIPNFEPNVILPKLAALLRDNDVLLFSANLAPGEDYEAGIRKVLPQYDNAPTREWLAALPADLGIENAPEDIHFEIAPCLNASDVKRIEAILTPGGDTTVRVASEVVQVREGDAIRLFFSCRYTPDLLDEQLQRHGLQVSRDWISTSGEEGVFLVERQGATI
jgi:uncharacterized SAM-dependent methyltransferase